MSFKLTEVPHAMFTYIISRSDGPDAMSGNAVGFVALFTNIIFNVLVMLMKVWLRCNAGPSAAIAITKGSQKISCRYI